MYAQVATRVEDCDSDADVFHAVTRKLSVIDVKRALTHRFKPEQIARLGNTHIVYPSFNRATFERLVATTTQRFLSDIQTTSGLQFKVSDALLKQLYDNGVFPSQGTRPLFSSIHSILSGALVHFTLWALEIGAIAGEQVLLDVNVGEILNVDVDGAGNPDSAVHEPAHDYISAELVASCQGQTTRMPILLEILQLKELRDSDFRALLAVHEAGHGLVYAMLFKQAPLQINIHVAAYSGGFNTLIDRQAKTSSDLINAICVYLAGRAAEQMVFGKDRVSSGSQNDLELATTIAAEYVRFLGFGERLSRTDQDSSEENNVNTDMHASNEAIETLLKNEFQRAQSILAQHKSVLLTMARALQTRGTLTRQEVMDWVGLSTEQPNICAYSAMLETFDKSTSPTDLKQ
jgi:cell division protease FtsH